MPGLYEIYREKLSDSEVYEKDDVYKEAKQQEIRCWYEDYFNLLFDTYMKKDIEKIKEFFRDPALWIKISNFVDAGDIRLDRTELGKRLINFKDNEDNYIFTQIMRYQIACRCGFEEEMKSLFEKLLLVDKISIRKEFARFRHLISDRPSREVLIERFQKHDKLVAFWSHWINRDIPEVSDKLKAQIGLDNSESIEENKQRLYEYAINNAGGNQYLESLGFFWDRLTEKKGELLIEAVLYASKVSSSNIISWCLRNLEASYQCKLAVKILESRFFTVLSNGYFWKDIKVLLNYLTPIDVAPDKYNFWISSVSESIVGSPKYFMKPGVHLLSFLWGLDGFDEHRKFCLDRKIYSPILMKLLMIGETEIVCRILATTNEKQLNKLLESHIFRVSYSDFKNKIKMDDFMKLFDLLKQKDRFSVEKFLKKNDSDNLEKIMNYSPSNSSNPYSYLAQSSAVIGPEYQLKGVSENVNLVTSQQNNFYERIFCHYPLL